MKTKNIIFIVPLVATLILSACGKKAPSASQADAAVSVSVEKVAAKAAGATLSVSGDVEGLRTVKLGFMVAGRIEQIYAEEGVMVQKGALVAKLDASNYAIAKELADVQVRQATDEHQRLQLMYERKSISESDYRKCCFALEGAKAQQKLHAKNLADTRLHAPISGILLKKVSEAGEIVASGQPILVVADISRVKVRAYIPEGQLREVHIGQQAKVRIEAIGQTVTGTVKEVGGAADPTSRSFTATVEVANPQAAIRPGMIAEVSIPTSGKGARLAVPARSILHTPDGVPYVYVVDAKKGQAFKRTISTGTLVGDDIEVVSGLKAGETIVTGGHQKLTNGSKVNISNKQ